MGTALKIFSDIYYDHMAECARWIYARALPDWSCPTKKLIEMIPIVSRLCLTDYFGSLGKVVLSNHSVVLRSCKISTVLIERENSPSSDT